MSDDRKKSLWPWIVALLVALPLIYVVSFGPACWASLRMKTGGGLVGAIYHPVFWLAMEKDVARGPTLWYLSAGAPPGVRPIIESAGQTFILRRDPS